MPESNPRKRESNPNRPGISTATITNARSRDRAYKITDGGGLYLLVTTDGAKYWRFKYRFAGKEKLLALGVHGNGKNGTIGAADARAARDDAKRLLRTGQDPAAVRQAEKRATKLASDTTFEIVARQWLLPINRGKKPWSADHADSVRGSLEAEIFPALGPRAINSITSPELLAALRKIQSRGALELAQRLLQRCGSIFGFAMAHGLCDRNPAADAQLGKLLKTPQHKNRASLSADDLPEFLKKLDAYDGQEQTKQALKLQILTFVRPGELRAARWDEFDVDRAQWLIPSERMKMRAPHIVPLSQQALEVLQELRKSAGDGPLLFPNQHRSGACISENTMLYAIYRMGYHSRATGHGFRATASTILNGQRVKRGKDFARRWNPDAIERQLSHGERDNVRAAYNHAEYLDERIEMMQAWADYVDTARRAGEKVVPIRKKA